MHACDDIRKMVIDSAYDGQMLLKFISIIDIYGLW